MAGYISHHTSYTIKGKAETSLHWAIYYKLPNYTFQILNCLWKELWSHQTQYSFKFEKQCKILVGGSTVRQETRVGTEHAGPISCWLEDWHNRNVAGCHCLGQAFLGSWLLIQSIVKHTQIAKEQGHFIYEKSESTGQIHCWRAESSCVQSAQGS